MDYIRETRLSTFIRNNAGKYITAKLSLSILLLFIFLNYLSANGQAAVMVLCSIYPIFLWVKNKRFESLTVLFILLLIGISLFSYLSESFDSLFFLISELKIIILFTFPSFFYLILEGKNYKIIALNFFKGYILISAIIPTYGSLVLNEFRYTGFLDHSIYISVSLVLLLSFLYDSLTIKWKLLILYTIFMLGSSNGMIIFFLVVVLKASIPIWMKILPMVLGIYSSYWYITVFRERDIFNGGFWEIDRVMIISSVTHYARENFSFINYLFGFGIGKPLEDFVILTRSNTNEVRGFVNWFYNTTFQGVFSFSFHNEFLRLLYNFGTLGILIIIFYLFNKMDKITFTALVIACLTNTIIYSTVGLFVISLIIAIDMLNKKEASKDGVGIV